LRAVLREADALGDDGQDGIVGWEAKDKDEVSRVREECKARGFNDEHGNDAKSLIDTAGLEL